MGLLTEFKAFAVRGNVVDLAVGVVIGAAFGKIVTAMVEKVIMPFIGFLTSGVDLAKASKKIVVPGLDAPPIEIGWGAFAQTIIDFIIVAFVIFLVVKAMNRLMRKQEAAPPPPAAEILLLTEIRDLLKQQQKN